jgi:hypothetical protein
VPNAACGFHGFRCEARRRTTAIQPPGSRRGTPVRRPSGSVTVVADSSPLVIPAWLLRSPQESLLTPLHLRGSALSLPRPWGAERTEGGCCYFCEADQAAGKRFPAVILSLSRRTKNPCIRRIKQMRRFSAQFALRQMKRILRFTQDGTRMAQDDSADNRSLAQSLIGRITQSLTGSITQSLDGQIAQSLTGPIRQWANRSSTRSPDSTCACDGLRRIGYRQSEVGG